MCIAVRTCAQTIIIYHSGLLLGTVDRETYYFHLNKRIDNLEAQKNEHILMSLPGVWGFDHPQ